MIIYQLSLKDAERDLERKLTDSELERIAEWLDDNITQILEGQAEQWED